MIEQHYEDERLQLLNLLSRVPPKEAHRQTCRKWKHNPVP